MPAVSVNGKLVSLPDGAMVLDAIEVAGASPDGRGVAVAVNGEVVPRAQWSTTPLEEGHEVEVLHAVQGG